MANLCHRQKCSKNKWQTANGLGSINRYVKSAFIIFKVMDISLFRVEFEFELDKIQTEILMML